MKLKITNDPNDGSRLVVVNAETNELVEGITSIILGYGVDDMIPQVQLTVNTPDFDIQFDVKDSVRFVDYLDEHMLGSTTPTQNSELSARIQAAQQKAAADYWAEKTQNTTPD